MAGSVRKALEECGIPVVALPEATKPAVARFGGLERFDDTVTSVRIVYEGGEPDGAWVSVQTARWTGTRVRAGSLRMMVEDHMRMCGDRISAVEWAEAEATAIVDGEPVPGRIVHAGSRWWAFRCDWGDIEISIVARDWGTPAIAVDTVADLEPLLSRLEKEPAPAARPVRSPELTPATRPVRSLEPAEQGPGREPHRALLDAALRFSRQHAQWRADGGPVPQLPRAWPALWQAAVHRQMTLADQTESQARRAVEGIVSQLSTLSTRADWFRADSQLRERAIAETLLFGTGLGDNVSSRLAQYAWQRRHGMAAPANYADVEAGAAVRTQWIDAWAAWADRHGKR